MIVKYIRDELENPELNQVNNFGKVIDLKKNQSGEFILFSAIKGNYKRLVLYNIKQNTNGTKMVDTCVQLAHALYTIPTQYNVSK